MGRQQTSYREPSFLKDKGNTLRFISLFIAKTKQHVSCREEKKQIRGSLNTSKWFLISFNARSFSSRNHIRSERGRNARTRSHTPEVTQTHEEREGDSPRSVWNLRHVFTATNMSSWFTGAPYDGEQNMMDKAAGVRSDIYRVEQMIWDY